MKFARDGIREMVGSGIVLLATAALALWLCRAPWGALLATPLAALWLWVMYFFRDPERKIPTGEGLIVSPADGVVSDITPVGADSELGEPGVRIGVFMNVFNVHVNRAPCDGELIETRCNRGKYMDVRLEDAWRLNESVVLKLRCGEGEPWPLVVRQIAGLVARRIVCRAKPGDRLARGQRFGLIKFGSRLEVMLPARLAAEIRVTVGQRAVAGETILAAIPSSNP